MTHAGSSAFLMSAMPRIAARKQTAQKIREVPTTDIAVCPPNFVQPWNLSVSGQFDLLVPSRRVASARYSWTKQTDIWRLYRTKDVTACALRRSEEHTSELQSL